MKGFAALALMAVTAACLAGPARAEGDEFSICVARLWPQARAKGVSQAVFDRAFQGVTMDPDVLAAARKQPEFVKPIWEYLDSAVSDSRVANGRASYAEWAQTLEAVERTYGVDRFVVLAIWGMESSYGAILDNPKVVKPVVRSLATLACGDPERADFGRDQLVAALQIVQRGDVSLGRMTGSWAGAMGHTQFIPTTYLAHAVDFNGDGRGHSVREVIEAVKRASGVDFEVQHAPRRAGDPPALVARSDLIHAKLCWQPRFDDLDVIVAHALAWERRTQSRRAAA